jgi:hypothetical protein
LVPLLSEPGGIKTFIELSLCAKHLKASVYQILCETANSKNEKKVNERRAEDGERDCWNDTEDYEISMYAGKKLIEKRRFGRL